jgi:hypothetical protein
MPMPNSRTYNLKLNKLFWFPCIIFITMKKTLVMRLNPIYKVREDYKTNRVPRAHFVGGKENFKRSLLLPEDKLPPTERFWDSFPSRIKQPKAHDFRAGCECRSCTSLWVHNDI